ncbi:Bug family tripartite tricarboxylate transporter substrate binding protein [Ottowia sp. VDI28]|uniref:Bug family tripartite tricarboxylate transporter substrate binding protein n=1 Tax=Ottowia sp. VDI28 TaxID=3133968 RepID=UPI003C2B16BB
MLATALQADLKQPVVVENKVGASGTIGAGFVAKAPADGYTLFFGTGSTHVIAPAMMKTVGYDPVKDFAPIGFIGRAPFVFFGGPGKKGKTLADVLEDARARPGQVSFGTTGTATVYEVAALLLESAGNVKFNHVPYKGFVPMQVDVSGGVVDYGIGPIDGFVKSEKAYVIATLGAKRAHEFPQVPAAGETGLAAFDAPAWAAIWAPAGTPPAVAARLSGALRTVLARKEVKDAIQATGIYVEPGDETMLKNLVTDQYANIQSIMRKAGMDPQ